MKAIQILAPLAVLLLAFHAQAGADAWTYAGTTRAAQSLSPGDAAEITPSTTGGTATLGLNCGSIRVHRNIDADPMTFDIEEFNSDGWDAINATSPIPATNTGYAEGQPPTLVRINVVADAGDVVRVTCNP